MTASGTTPETNAGICPKSDISQPWIYPFNDKNAVSYYPPETPVPGKKLLCGESSGKICIFPFSLSGSALYYEPYKDASGESRCGTKDNKLVPIDYYDVDELELAILCSSEYSFIKGKPFKALKQFIFQAIR